MIDRKPPLKILTKHHDFYLRLFKSYRKNYSQATYYSHVTFTYNKERMNFLGCLLHVCHGNKLSNLAIGHHDSEYKCWC